jgi:hypothetical protein
MAGASALHDALHRALEPSHRNVRGRWSITGSEGLMSADPKPIMKPPVKDGVMR